MQNWLLHLSTPKSTKVTKKSSLLFLLVAECSKAQQSTADTVFAAAEVNTSTWWLFNPYQKGDTFLFVGIYVGMFLTKHAGT